MNDCVFIFGSVYFCFPDSKNVKLISDNSKIRIESFIGERLGTSAKLHFDNEILWGDFKKIKIELLSLDPIIADIERGVPLLLLFSKSMLLGIFIPDRPGGRRLGSSL